MSRYIKNGEGDALIAIDEAVIIAKRLYQRGGASCSRVWDYVEEQLFKAASEW